MSAIWKGGWQEKFTNDIDMGSAHVQSIHNLQVRLHNYLILQEYVLKIKAVKFFSMGVNDNRMPGGFDQLRQVDKEVTRMLPKKNRTFILCLTPYFFPSPRNSMTLSAK